MQKQFCDLNIMLYSNFKEQQFIEYLNDVCIRPHVDSTLWSMIGHTENEMNLSLINLVYNIICYLQL